VQSFFFYEWDTYRDTASELQWRLRGIFKKQIIGDMLSADKTRFHIGRAMDEGKVIVIDNSQAKCGGPEMCGFFGRLFVSQIWSAGTARQGRPDHLKKPTYVYIDEAHLVIKKDQKIAAIIDELRSQKVGLILAHQKLRGQIDDTNVLSSLENCAIKMVNVGAEVDYFSKLLGIPAERMMNLPQGHFATDIRWEGNGIRNVEKAELPFRDMTQAEQEAHRRRMRELYGVDVEKAHDGAKSVRGQVTSPATLEVKPVVPLAPKVPETTKPDGGAFLRLNQLAMQKMAKNSALTISSAIDQVLKENADLREMYERSIEVERQSRKPEKVYEPAKKKAPSQLTQDWEPPEN
jgi:hypothetical protein